MQTLTVPAPELVFDPPSGVAELEKPVTVRLSAVRYPDGSEMSKDDVRTIGAFVYRGSPGSEDVWDEQGQLWTAAPSDLAALAALTPVPLTPAEGESTPWKGTLIAVGQKDKAGNARYSKAEGGASVYRLRVLAHAVRNGVEHRGVGAPSADLRFISAAEQQRFALSFDTSTARDAGRARFTLKDAALQPAGYVEIRAAGGREVEIANCTPSGAVLARITISAEGDIRLAPAAGRQIILDGPLEAQRITYMPQSGTGRLPL